MLLYGCVYNSFLGRFPPTFCACKQVIVEKFNLKHIWTKVTRKILEIKWLKTNGN